MNGTDPIDPLMLHLTRNLDRHGLRMNQKKVEIWPVRDLQKHRCRSIHEFFAKKGDNQDPMLVRMFVDAYLKISEKKLAEIWKGGLPLLNRLLWAKIDSLPQKLFNILIPRFVSPESLLQAEKEKLVRVERP